MTEKLFWAVAALLLAAAIHLSTVLFIPQMEMDKQIEEFVSVAGKNQLVVLNPEQTSRLILQPNPGLAYAVCVFDMADGPVHVSAAIPDNYWSLDIYSPRGDTIYSMNDRQANVPSLTIILKEPAGEEEVEADEAEQLDPNGSALADTTSLTLRPTVPSGVVIMRARVVDPAFLSRVTDQLSRSSCTSQASV